MPEVSANTAPAATGAEAYLAALGIGGSSQGAASLVTIPSALFGRVPRLNVTTSRILTLSDCASGILTSTTPGTTILTLPTLSQLGYTRNYSNPVEIGWLLSTGGFGPLFVTPSVYHGAVANQAAMLALSAAVVGDWCQRADSNNAVYQLVALPYSTLGNWSLRNGSHRPRIFFGAIANQAAMIALSSALIGDWCTRTDQSSDTYQLTTEPYSSAGNWTVRSDAEKPTVPEIRIQWNDLEPQYLPKDHPEIWLKTNGQDSLVAS